MSSLLTSVLNAELWTDPRRVREPPFATRVFRQSGLSMPPLCPVFGSDKDDDANEDDLPLSSSPSPSSESTERDVGRRSFVRVYIELCFFIRDPDDADPTNDDDDLGDDKEEEDCFDSPDPCAEWRAADEAR